MTTPPSVGCLRLRVLSLNDVEKLQLSTLSLLLLHLPKLRAIEHNQIHETMFLMVQTGMPSFCPNFTNFKTL